MWKFLLLKKHIDSDDDLDYWTFGHLDYWTIGHCPIQVQFSIGQNTLCPIATKFYFFINLTLFIKIWFSFTKIIMANYYYYLKLDK